MNNNIDKTVNKENANATALLVETCIPPYLNLWQIGTIAISLTVSLFSDDNGWKVRQQHLGPSEECHPGDSEEEQQWAELWGAVQECLHHGAPQARGEALHRPAGGRHGTPHQQSKELDVSTFVSKIAVCHSRMSRPQRRVNAILKSCLLWSQNFLIVFYSLHNWCGMLLLWPHFIHFRYEKMSWTPSTITFCKHWTKRGTTIRPPWSWSETSLCIW